MMKLSNCFLFILFSLGLSTINACKSVYDFETCASDKMIKIILKNPDIEDIGIGIWSVSLNIIDLKLTSEQVDSMNFEYNNSNVHIFNAIFNNYEELPFLEIFTDDTIFLISEQELPHLKYCKEFSRNKGKDYILKCMKVLENKNDVNISKDSSTLRWYVHDKYKISPGCLKLFKKI